MTIESQVAAIFAKGGLLEQKTGQHRPAQGRLARKIARCNFDPAPRAPDDDGVFSQDSKVLQSYYQAPTGTGKSFAVLIPAALYAMQHTERVGIATYTQTQRLQLVGRRYGGNVSANDNGDPKGAPAVEQWIGRDGAVRTQQDIIDEICTETLGRPCHVRIRELPSLSSWPSISHAQDMKTQIEAKSHRSDVDLHALAYCNFVLSNPDATFDEWREQEISLEKLPYGLSQRQLAAKITDAQSRADAARFLAMRDDADQAHIVVFTQALLLENAIAHGGILNPQSDERCPAPVTRLVIDEADNLANLGMNMTDHLVSIADLREAFATIGVTPSNKDLMAAIFASLNRVEAIADSNYPAYSSIRTPIVDADPLRELTDEAKLLVAAFEPVVDRLDDVACELKIRELMQPIIEIANWATFAGTARKEVYRHSKSRSRVVFNRPDHDLTDLRVGTKPTNASGLINRIWNGSSVTFDAITFMSATLTSPEEDARLDRGELVIEGTTDLFRSFRRRIGSYTDKMSRDDVTRIERMGDRVVSTEIIEAGDFGRIGTLYVVSSTAPKPTLPQGERVGESAGENQSGLSYDNPDHNRMIAQIIARAAEEPGRTFVPFASERKMLAVSAILREMGIANPIFEQKAGTKAMAQRADFKDSPDGIWLALNWAGENFVSNGRSLISRVIIPQVPIPVVGDHMINLGFGKTFRDALSDGYRKLIQGIGRGIRAAGDEIDLWIADPRFPCPAAMESMFKGVPGVTLEDVLPLPLDQSSSWKSMSHALRASLLKTTKRYCLVTYRDGAIAIHDRRKSIMTNIGRRAA